MKKRSKLSGFSSTAQVLQQSVPARRETRPAVVRCSRTIQGQRCAGTMSHERARESSRQFGSALCTAHQRAIAAAADKRRVDEIAAAFNERTTSRFPHNLDEQPTSVGKLIGLDR
jgi:hypothetical protein